MRGHRARTSYHSATRPLKRKVPLSIITSGGIYHVGMRFRVRRMHEGGAALLYLSFCSCLAFRAGSAIEAACARFSDLHCIS
jgi:hypothetical protein